jgi:anti-sigma factor RsiW
MSEVTEQDLHAYVDGRLEPARRGEIEAFLAANSEAAEKVAAYRRQSQMLRALFDPAMDEPVPSRFRRPLRQPWPMVRYAAMVAWLGIGVVVGYFLRSPGIATVAVPLAQQAAIAHAVYAPEVLHPVEVGAAQEPHLVAWLSKRLGGEVRPPDLARLGYELVGGRLLPGGEKPAAQFMYQDARGQRITLYVRHDEKGGRETAFRYARQGNVSVFYWLDREFGYALSGELAKDDLLRVARVVYEQLNP